jgi:hypothetical protein
MDIGEDGYFEGYKKPLSDGRIIAVTPLTFGRARLIIGNEYLVDNGW